MRADRVCCASTSFVRCHIQPDRLRIHRTEAVCPACPTARSPLQTRSPTANLISSHPQLGSPGAIANNSSKHGFRLGHCVLSSRHFPTASGRVQEGLVKPTCRPYYAPPLPMQDPIISRHTPLPRLMASMPLPVQSWHCTTPMGLSTRPTPLQCLVNLTTSTAIEAGCGCGHGQFMPRRGSTVPVLPLTCCYSSSLLPGHCRGHLRPLQVSSPSLVGHRGRSK